MEKENTLERQELVRIISDMKKQIKILETKLLELTKKVQALE